MFDVDEAKLRYYEKIRGYVEPHIDTLSLKREQLVYKNDYGVEENDKWRVELGKFIREILLPSQKRTDTTIFKAYREPDVTLGDFLFEMKISSSGSRPTKKAGKRITEVFDEAIFDHLSKKEET
ncbi:hypothetical protein QWY74_13015, partial [Halomonas almeriensis]|uniref:hypothetical protein n=1 Tax=Halomonas almeriensis TaxID=308163 RepID=UPI0025B5C755